MSPHTHTASSANADQRLSKLIKLKQLEKPDAAFWETFEQEFRSRQLTTFVHIQPMHTRLRRACMIIARKAAPPVAAAGAVALTFFAVTNTRFLSKGTETEVQAPSDSLAQAEPSEDQEAYFTVKVEDAPDSPSESISSDTIYQINSLASQGGSSNGYLLNATPVTFSQNAAAQTSGANILSKKSNY